MLAKLLREYSKVKTLNLPDIYSEPKETKLKEFAIAFSKINKDNFDELNDITYEDILKDKLYLFPETNINFILRINKIFKPKEKIVNFMRNNDCIYDFPAFIANKLQNPTDFNVSIFYKHYKTSEYVSDINRVLALMLDEISETRGDKNFVFIENKYGKDKIDLYFHRLAKIDFIPVYGLGFNILTYK